MKIDERSQNCREKSRASYDILTQFCLVADHVSTSIIELKIKVFPL